MILRDVAAIGFVAAALSAIGASGCAPTRGAAYERSLAEARRAVHAGRFDEAAVKYDEAAKGAKQPRDAVWMRYEAALARVRAGDVARGAAELRAIAAERPAHAYSAQAAFKAADLSWRTDPEGALHELEEVAVTYPDSGVGHVALLRVIRHDDQTGGAAKALARLDRLAPRVAGKRLEEAVAYQRARRLADLGRTDEARAAFLDVASRFPYPFGAYNDDALFRAAEMEEKLGRTKEAIAILERLLSQRETSSLMGTYERTRYVPAVLRIATLYEEKLGDRAKARETLHRLYADFKTSPLRDDALWREAELWRKDGDTSTACDRLATLADDFPDSRYVPCAVEKCPSIKRPAKSKAPTTCRPYIGREPSRGADDENGADESAAD